MHDMIRSLQINAKHYKMSNLSSQFSSASAFLEFLVVENSEQTSGNLPRILFHNKIHFLEINCQSFECCGRQCSQCSAEGDSHQLGMGHIFNHVHVGHYPRFISDCQLYLRQYGVFEDRTEPGRGLCLFAAMRLQRRKPVAMRFIKYRFERRFRGARIPNHRYGDSVQFHPNVRHFFIIRFRGTSGEGTVRDLKCNF